MVRLYLSHLTLSHFRSHRRTVLDIDATPVVIFGQNGVGKTNLLEAISLLAPGRGLRRAKTHDMARQEQNIGWKLSAQLHSKGQVCEIETAYDGNGNTRSVLIDDKAAAQSTLSQYLRLVWLVPTMDRLWVEGAQGRRQFLDRLTLSFAPDHGRLSNSYDRAMRERNRLIKTGSTDPRWFDALEAQMATAGSAIEQNRLDAISRILEAQNQSQSSFPAADLELIGADDRPIFTDKNTLADAIGAERARDIAAGRSLIGPHRSDLRATYRAKSLPVQYCSTGEQKALLINLILSSARALSADFGAPPILLLDEIGAHLDANRRAALYDEISALGAQAWMTGTDAELFSQITTDAAQFCVFDGADGSTIERINP